MMKTKLFFWITLLTFSICTSCTKNFEIEEDYDYTVGYVGFRQLPTYKNDTLSFAIKVLLTTEDESTSVKYKIDDETNTLISSSSIAVTKDYQLYKTDTLKYYLPSAEFNGQTITVTIDPYNEYILSEDIATYEEEDWKTYNITIE